MGANTSTEAGSNGLPCLASSASSTPAPRAPTISRINGSSDLLGALRSLNETHKQTVTRADQWMSVLSERLDGMDAQLKAHAEALAEAKAREERVIGALSERLDELSVETREAASYAARNVLMEAAGGLGGHTNGHTRPLPSFGKPRAAAGGGLLDALKHPAVRSEATTAAPRACPNLLVADGEVPPIPPRPRAAPVRRKSDGRPVSSATSEKAVEEPSPAELQEACCVLESEEKRG